MCSGVLRSTKGGKKIDCTVVCTVTPNIQQTFLRVLNYFEERESICDPILLSFLCLKWPYSVNIEDIIFTECSLHYIGWFYVEKS